MSKKIIFSLGILFSLLLVFEIGCKYSFKTNDRNPVSEETITTVILSNDKSKNVSANKVNKHSSETTTTTNMREEIVKGSRQVSLLKKVVMVKPRLTRKLLDKGYLILRDELIKEANNGDSNSAFLFSKLVEMCAEFPQDIDSLDEFIYTTTNHFETPENFTDEMRSKFQICKGFTRKDYVIQFELIADAARDRHLPSLLETYYLPKPHAVSELPFNQQEYIAFTRKSLEQALLLGSVEAAINLATLALEEDNDEDGFLSMLAYFQAANYFQRNQSLSEQVKILTEDVHPSDLSKLEELKNSYISKISSGGTIILTTVPATRTQSNSSRSG